MRLYWLLLISLLAPFCHGEVNTSLSRYTMTQQDTVRLTIEVTHTDAISRPDLSTLAHNFIIVGSKKVTISNRLRSGQQATTRWQILLRPRHSGDITIAPLVVHGERSLPLTLKVLGLPTAPRQQTKAAPTPTKAPAAFMQTAVEHREGYEGSEFHYVAKFYHKAPLSNDQLLRAPYLDSALILENGSPQTQQLTYQGEPYYQTLYRYLIYPDSIDKDRIEAPHFTGTSINGDFYDARGNAVQLDILPRPQNNTRGYWLPAERLELTDSLQQPEHLEPGSTLIRTLTLTAFGLPSERLPPLSPLKNELAKLSMLDTDLAEKFTPEGLMSTRVERIEIKVTERGEVTLPPIDIYWWDTYEDRGKVASLQPVILRVEPPSGQAPPQVVTPKPATPPALSHDDSKVEKVESAAAATPTSSEHRPFLLVGILVLISLVSSLGWLYTYHHFKRRRTIGADHVDTDHSPATRQRTLQQAETNAYKALMSACQSNQAALAKTRLIEWAQRFWPDAQINNCEAISRQAHNSTLDFLIIDLEQNLYKSDSGPWQGDLLLQTIDTLRHRRQRQPTLTP